MSSIYKKTAKGQTEIETRVNRLVPRLRTSLILVDGKRTDDELRTMIAADADQVLATLLADGYIEVISTTPPPRAAAAAPPAGDSPSPRKLEETRRAAVRFLNDNLGPSAESLALKIERAQNWGELKPHLEMAEHFLRAGRGPAVAQEFVDKFLERPAP
ncbi:MAG: hypothetical protein IV105_02220 [Rhizobacter sp.]|nr:hypothetical protein [Rhizobacter sp.]